MTTYTKTVWATGDVITATKFNNNENGTESAHTDIDAHIALTTGIHGAVSAATASKLVIRDASGRTQFADPSASADAATKAYADLKVAKAGDTIAGDLVVSGYVKPGILRGDGGSFEGNAVNPNLVPNSSFRQGKVFWTDVAGTWTAVVGSAGAGSYVQNGQSTGAGVYNYTKSVTVPFPASTAATLSFDAYTLGLTAGPAGAAYMEIDWFTSGLVFISTSVVSATNTTDWTRYSGTVTSPGTAAYADIRCVIQPLTTNTLTAFRRIKFEKGSSATLYTSEADYWYYHTHGAQGAPLVMNSTLGGFTMQYEGNNARSYTLTSTTSQKMATVTFATAFRTACVFVQVFGGNSSIFYVDNFAGVGLSTASFDAYVMPHRLAAGTESFSWGYMAVGY